MIENSDDDNQNSNPRRHVFAGSGVRLAVSLPCLHLMAIDKSDSCISDPLGYLLGASESLTDLGDTLDAPVGRDPLAA